MSSSSSSCCSALQEATVDALPSPLLSLPFSVVHHSSPVLTTTEAHPDQLTRDSHQNNTNDNHNSSNRSSNNNNSDSDNNNNRSDGIANVDCGAVDDRKASLASSRDDGGIGQDPLATSISRNSDSESKRATLSVLESDDRTVCSACDAFCSVYQ